MTPIRDPRRYPVIAAARNHARGPRAIVNRRCPDCEAFGIAALCDAIDDGPPFELGDAEVDASLGGRISDD